MISLLAQTQLHWHRLALPAYAQQAELWLVQLSEAYDGLSGNKIAKLHLPHQLLQTDQYQGIATFGGAFSNHLLATAVVCQQLGKPSLGLVRGPELDANNPTLQRCQQLGMHLQPLSRADYRLRADADFLAAWQARWPDYLWLPEGGSNEQGVAGVELLDFAQTPTGLASHLVCAVGSGGTLAGLASGHSQQQLLGIAVVKDASLATRIGQLTPARNWQLLTQYCQAGYGRFDAPLWQFCQSMRAQQVNLEPIYSGKALHGLYQHWLQHPPAAGSRWVFFHTGGLQGLAGLRYRGLIDDA